jgi:Phosphoinositide phospholipase C, Ca2+-dependent
MRLWTILIALLSLPSALLAQTVESGTINQALKMNQVQAIGTHNSYKIAIPRAEMQIIASRSQAAATSLDYSHMPLNQQLDLGMRQLELDVLYDPQGGRYARPALPRMTRNRPGSVAYDASQMMRPGYKVLHAQDVDVRSHCPTFIMCLSQIDAWSKAHPDHVPLLIMINAKDGASSVPFGVKALDYDAAAFDALDNEIRSVFGPNRLVTPDNVRGGAPTLREAVLNSGWLDLGASRGKVFFALDEPPAKVITYMRGKASLEGLPMFVNSIGDDQPHSAYFTINHPVRQFDRIAAAVAAGFIVRTRADSEPAEAKANDPARLNAALSSGAHYISTDYPTPRADFGPYQVRLPEGAVARVNPVSVKR